jgi:hypothetical protein
MRLPNYNECSLQELHKFIADRHIPFRFTRAQAHTKTQYKRDKEERRKLTAALEKADAAATIRFMDLPLELRDEIYEYHLTEITTAELLTRAELRERMSSVSPQFWMEARDVLNRGEYNILPELALDDSRVSLTQTQDTCTCSAHNMAPDSIASYSIGRNPLTSQIGFIGSMRQGKPAAVLRARTTKPLIGPRDNRPSYPYILSTFRYRYMSALDPFSMGYEVTIYTPLYLSVY